MRRKFFGALGAAMALAILLLAISPAIAEEPRLLWIGGSDNWSAPGNWLKEDGKLADAAPGAGDIAVFKVDANVTVDTAVSGIKIDVQSGNVTLKGDKKLTLKEKVGTDISLWVAEAATLTTETGCLELPKTGDTAIRIDGKLSLGGTTNVTVPAGKTLWMNSNPEHEVLAEIAGTKGFVFGGADSVIWFCQGDMMRLGANSINAGAAGGTIVVAPYSTITAMDENTFTGSGPITFKGGTLKLEAKLPGNINLTMTDKAILDVRGLSVVSSAGSKVTMGPGTELHVAVPDNPVAAPFATFGGALVIVDPGRDEDDWPNFVIHFDKPYGKWKVNVGDVLTPIKAHGGLKVGAEAEPLTLANAAEIVYRLFNPTDSNMIAELVFDVGTGAPGEPKGDFTASLDNDTNPTAIRLTTSYKSIDASMAMKPDLPMKDDVPTISVNMAGGAPVPQSVKIFTLKTDVPVKPKVVLFGYIDSDGEDHDDGLPPGMEYALSEPVSDGYGNFVTTLTIHFGKDIKNGKYGCAADIYYDNVYSEVNLLLSDPFRVEVTGGTDPAPGPKDQTVTDWTLYLHQDEKDGEGYIPVTITARLHLAEEPSGFLGVDGVGFKSGSLSARFEGYVEGYGKAKAKAAMRARTAAIKSHPILIEGKTKDIAKASITELWYTTKIDGDKKSILLPSEGKKLSEMRRPHPGDHVHYGGGGEGYSGSCNAGGAGAIAMFAFLALPLLRKKD